MSFPFVGEGGRKKVAITFGADGAKAKVTAKGLRKFGVSKENRRQPIVQAGLFLMQDATGEDIRAILKAYGIEIQPKIYTKGEIREIKSTVNPF